MGKSAPSCFKIIACGSDSVDHDDLQAPESKGSSGRGWSFRKRSARHRVLSNTVNSTPSSLNKESPEPTTINYQGQPNSTAPEKTSVIQWTEEKTELPSQPDLKISDKKIAEEDGNTADATFDESSIIITKETAEEDGNTTNATFDESSIIIIQAAVRRLLARKELLKQKNVIKLQAAVRGHLVRCHAVGTLRCVQAIVKMQALVRARRARVHVEGSSGSEKQSINNEMDNSDPTLLKEKEQSKPNGTYAYISIEKLLSNGFARQLMESTPRTKPINIKCDPLKSDSAWTWLERWMAASAVSSPEPQESGTAAEQHERENLGHSDSKNDILVTSDSCSESTNIKSADTASVEVSENDDNLITYDTNNLDPHTFQSISPPPGHAEVQKIEEANSTNDIPEFAPSEVKESESVLNVEAKSLQDEEETGKEQGIPDLEKTPAEQSDADAKKFSRKASNPSFIAAQSKFEELTSAATSAKSTNSFNHDPREESSLDNVSSVDQPVMSSEVDNSISNASAIQLGGSECGTELSISSTLDSPERFEVGINELEQEPKISDEADSPKSSENVGLEVKGTSSVKETDPSYPNTKELERFESAISEFRENAGLEDNETSCVKEIDPAHTDMNQLGRHESAISAAGKSVISEIAVDSSQFEKKPEADSGGLHLEVGSEASHMAYKSSPEASPRSHTTVPESQATPSSQVSVKPKKSRGDKSDSNCKNRSSSSDKKSRSNRNQESTSRSSVEQLPEHKSAKRRNSFGSSKSDNADQEPRDSSSSNTLPSYMQATESARAKAIANGSPRSSPDVHEKDIYIKKRHSLPGTNGRQGSPRIQRSLSQAQQTAKVNGTQSPQDRKWRR